MKKKAYLRTIEVTIAVIITFAVAYFIMPRASVTLEDTKISVLPTLEQKQEFRDCVLQLNYGCVEGYLRDFAPPNYDFAFDITDDPNTPHAGLPDKRIVAESIYISGSNNPQSANREGLVLAYNFDINVTDLNYVTDLSDLGVDGRLFGPQWVAEGYYGGSYLFDGSNDYIATDKSSPILNLPLTIIALIKKSGDGIILTSGFPQYGNAAVLFVDGGKLGARFNDGAGGSNSKTGTTTLQNGVWYNVAAVIRGNNDMDIYINGVNDGGVYSGFATSFSPQGSVFMGGGAGQYFSGQIGPIRLYNRALSVSELTNMNVVSTEINLYNPKIIKVYYWRKG